MKAIALLVLVSASASATGPQSSEESAKASKPQLELRFRSQRYGKPPLKYVTFSAVVRNEQPGPRWFLLPEYLYIPPQELNPDVAHDVDVEELKVFRLKGAGKAILARLPGTGGVLALYLPAHAELTIEDLTVEVWGHEDSIQMTAHTGSALQLGGQPAEDYFGVTPLSDAKGDFSVAGSIDVTPRRNTRPQRDVQWHLEDDHPVTATMLAKPE